MLIEKTGGGDVLRLRAVVVRRSSEDDLVKRAALLRRDSIHGSFDGDDSRRQGGERNPFIANGNEVKLIYADAPENVDYTAYGINDAIVIDNTGKWRDEEPAVTPSAGQGRGEGDPDRAGQGRAEEHRLRREPRPGSARTDRIITAASCTTNAIVPALKVVDEQFGIVSGPRRDRPRLHQRPEPDRQLPQEANRRGRSAALNMVVTETGAASAVAKVLPSMAGKLTGNAIRVPVPNVSMAILHLTLARPTTVEEVNEFMRWASLHSPLSRQIDFTASPEVVSSDFVGSRAACIHDAEATIVHGNSAILYLWYDNEFGYACQVYRVLEQVAGVHYASYPETASVAWHWPRND
jgi:glyceraldehyde 3-phosphate dehydrogenase